MAIPPGDFRSLQRKLSKFIFDIVNFLVPFGRDEPHFLNPAYHDDEPRIETYLKVHWRSLQRSGNAVELQAQELETGEEIDPLDEYSNLMLNELKKADAAADSTWLRDYLSTKVMA